jgi:uncharacterized protein YPO0396
MKRKINLTRIHAINWYGYRDSFDVNGDALIAGITGSGKSVLMDLIQYVLVADQRKTRYNQSATGERSTRDLIGYCLGDVKQDIAGARQFMRQKGGITYVALEFAWPGGTRVETWGLRIEFESALRKEPSRYSPFFVPTSLTRDEFLDGDRRPLDFSAFKQLVEDLHKGRIFNGSEEYRREMALTSHLNFDRPTLDYLLPAAMSFTFMDSFNDFCRRYILPSEEVDIQSVKDSYLMFCNLNRELGFLRDQQDKLEAIATLEQQRAAADRDRVVTRYLEAEFRCESARERWLEKELEMKRLEQTLAEELQQISLTEANMGAVKKKIESITSTMQAMPGGDLFLHLTNENRMLVTRIEQLKQVGQSVEEAKLARARNASAWLKQVQALPFKVETLLLEAAHLAANQLADAEADKIQLRVKHLVGTVGAVLRAVSAGARPASDSHTSLQQEIEKHNAALAVLRLGTLPENTVLLAELNKHLPRRGAEPSAQALWQLCEVTDERWRPALEVAFARKFAVVVDATDYDQAERIYQELRHEARGESLINPGQVPATPRQPGSLAEKLETNHPIARAVVDHLFGDVICVERREDLRKHARAILPDGFMAQRPFVQRSRHYDNRPCIGKRGLEKQQAWLANQIDMLRARQRQLAPVLNAVKEVQLLATTHCLESENLHDELEQAKQLPAEETRLKENLDTLTRIRSADLDERQKELADAANELAGLESKWKRLYETSSKGRLEAVQNEAKTAKEIFASLEERFKEVRNAEDVSVHLRRADELRLEVSTTFPAKDVAAGEFHALYIQANTDSGAKRAELIAERKILAAHPDYGTHYSDYDPETTTNERYDKRLASIKAGEIKEYEEKATREEVNWQQLFRTQVLEKLREKLMEVENLMDLLKAELKDPIGYNRYRITSTPNRDAEYQVYRKLIDAASYARDNELLFASADAEVRETVDKLFDQLTKQSDNQDALAFLDYRNYHDYDMLVEDIREPDQPPSSLNRHSGMFSGGENQAPFFIAILACYLRAYRRYERRRRDPSLAVVPIDEAFSKLSGDCIHDCIAALRHLDLQGIFSMSTGNIPYAIDHCDQVIAVHKQVTSVGKKKTIRNVAVTLTRQAAYQQFGRSASK